MGFLMRKILLDRSPSLPIIEVYIFTLPMKYFLIFLLAFFSFLPRTFAVSEFLPYAEMLVENAIISPQTSEAGYRLSSTITRAEMAKLTMLLSGLEQNDCRYISSYTFPDVDKSYGDLCGYIEGAALNEIIQSGNGVKFRPKQNVTRAELAKMFLSGIGESPIEESVGYNDVTSSLGNLAGYVNALGTMGCAQLTSSFRPNATATRGEAFKMAACVIGLYDPTGSTETGTTDTSGTYNLQVYNTVDSPVQSGQTARVIGSFSFKANGSTGTFTSLSMASVGTVDLLTTINTVDLYQGSTRIGTASVGHNTLTFNGFSITLPKDTLTYFTIKASIIGTGSSPIALQIPTSSSIGITYANGSMTPNDSYPVDFPSVYFNSSLGSITLLQ